MADDFSLGTLGQGVAPQVAPNALQARRALALALQKEGMDTSPIRSPWQGAGRIAQSIAGGLSEYQTNKQESDQRQDYARHISAAMDADTPLNERRAHLAQAYGNPVANPELTKSVEQFATPQRVERGLGSIAIDPLTQKEIPNSFLPKTNVGTVEAGGVKAPYVFQGTNGGNSASEIPIRDSAPPGASGGPPVFDQSGRLQGNVSGNKGQPPAPSGGAVGTQPAGPLPPKVVGMARQANQLENEKKGGETAAVEGAKYYDSLYKGVRGSATVAAQQKQNIDLLRQVVSSPNFTPGAGGETALGLQRLAANLGINPTAASPREIFNQVSARILADQFAGIKSMASETGESGGRIFKSFLEMEEKANITPKDSAEGIKAKLNILDKSGDLMMRWGDLADDYAIAHGGRLDAGFDKTLRKEVAGARISNAVPQSGQSAAPQSAAKITHSREDIEAEMRRRAKP